MTFEDIQKYVDQDDDLDKDTITAAEQAANTAVALVNTDYNTSDNLSKLIQDILKKYIKYDACTVKLFKFPDPPYKVLNNEQITDENVFIVYKNKQFIEQSVTYDSIKCMYVAYNKYYKSDPQINIEHTAIFYNYTDVFDIKLNNWVTSLFLFGTLEPNFELSYNVRELYLNNSTMDISMLKMFPMLSCLYLHNSIIFNNTAQTDILYIHNGHDITNENIKHNEIKEIHKSYFDIYDKIVSIYDNELGELINKI